jgi:hypothetical protein
MKKLQTIREYKDAWSEQDAGAGLVIYNPTFADYYVEKEELSNNIDAIRLLWEPPNSGLPGETGPTLPKDHPHMKIYELAFTHPALRNIGASSSGMLIDLLSFLKAEIPNISLDDKLAMVIGVESELDSRGLSLGSLKFHKRLNSTHMEYFAVYRNLTRDPKQKYKQKKLYDRSRWRKLRDYTTFVEFATAERTLFSYELKQNISNELNGIQTFLSEYDDRVTKFVKGFEKAYLGEYAVTLPDDIWSARRFEEIIESVQAMILDELFSSGKFTSKRPCYLLTEKILFFLFPKRDRNIPPVDPNGDAIRLSYQRWCKRANRKSD